MHPSEAVLKAFPSSLLLNWVQQGKLVFTKSWRTGEDPGFEKKNRKIGHSVLNKSYMTWGLRSPFLRSSKHVLENEMSSSWFGTHFPLKHWKKGTTGSICIQMYIHRSAIWCNMIPPSVIDYFLYIQTGILKVALLEGGDLKKQPAAWLFVCVCCVKMINHKLCIFQRVEDLSSCAGSATTLLNSNEGRS